MRSCFNFFYYSSSKVAINQVNSSYNALSYVSPKAGNTKIPNTCSPCMMNSDKYIGQCLMKRLYSTVASPVLRSKVWVLACAYPLAHRNTPVPPTTAISRTAENTSFRPMMATVLPLYLPPWKTKFMFMRSATVSLPALM
uniref:Uncharacterized protein n=1 Tax=Arundo donax TaxID=35708 RepID=A0A0A9DBW1_ARUDO